MNTIKLNNETFEVLSFNKNTNFTGETIVGSGNISVKTSNLTALRSLGISTIDTIQIYHDDTLIYNLTDANGKITSIDEYLSENTVNISLSLQFSFDDE